MGIEFVEYVLNHDHAFTGRAATAIYLLLKAESISAKEVIVPANVCYAAVLPIIYSGNSPRFVDVGHDGNLTAAQVAAAWSSEVVAAIVPHMYGNPCGDIAGICRYLHDRSVLVIEDCCMAMGARLGGSLVGRSGDYAVYSFGYSKTLDLGYGGLIVSRKCLDGVRVFNAALPPYDGAIEHEIQLFSQLYRVLRNHPETLLARQIIRIAPRLLKGSMLFRAPIEHEAHIRQHLSDIDDVIRRRREMVTLYERSLEPHMAYETYHFSPGAAPWRFNILVDPRQKPNLVKHLLAERVAVSDWYPVIAPMFGTDEPFPQCAAMERRILNFPLMGIGPKGIRNVAAAVNRFFRQVAA